MVSRYWWNDPGTLAMVKKMHQSREGTGAIRDYLQSLGYQDGTSPSRLRGRFTELGWGSGSTDLLQQLMESEENKVLGIPGKESHAEFNRRLGLVPFNLDPRINNIPIRPEYIRPEPCDREPYVFRPITGLGSGPELEPAPEPATIPVDHTDKKRGYFNWREFTKPLVEMQKQIRGSSWSQDRAHINFSHLTEPICIVGISDLHMGSWGTDYETLIRVTDEIIQTPGLYVACLGDLLQMSIKFRSVLEMADNAMPPKIQHYYLESWLREIEPKVLFSTWDNHSVMREEAQAGHSLYSEIFSRRVVYHNGIGHVDLALGSQLYKIASSHAFRGRSYLNPLHSQMRYIRMEAPDREIIMAGDSHVPAFNQFTDGGRLYTTINGGTTQTNSGYAKRFFSLTTSDTFPCVVLDPEEHMITPYGSVKSWLKACRPGSRRQKKEAA